MHSFTIDTLARTMHEDRLREAEQRRLARRATQRQRHDGEECEPVPQPRPGLQAVGAGSDQPDRPRGTTLWEMPVARTPCPTLVDTGRRLP